MTLHRANRTEIELRVPSREHGQALQERLGALRAERLEPLLDRVCGELSAPDRLDRIDRLELDLGRIAWDDFDPDFFLRLEQALREALSRRLTDWWQDHEQPDPALDLLRCYALTGNLPWWVGRGDPGLLRRQLALVLNTAPAALHDLLHELAEDSRALARLDRLAGVDLFAALLATAAGAGPEGAGPRSEPSLGGSAAVGTAGSASSAEYAAFRQRLLRALARVPVDASSRRRASPSAATWRAVWRVLSDNPAARARLAQLADDDLLAELRAAAGDAGFETRERQPRQPHPDPAALARLERMAGGITDIVAATRNADRADRSVADGHFGAPAQVGATLDADSPGESATDGGKALPHQFAVSRQPPAGSAPVPADGASLRDAHDGSGRPVQARARGPGPADAIAADVAPAGIRPADSTAGRAPEAAAGAHAPTWPGVAAPAGTGSSARRVRGPRPESMSSSPRTAPLVARRRQSALRELEELYVEDAGLVLLWPFLRRCFARCDLLAEPEPRFATPLAQQQAVGLLSWLTLQDPLPPEHQLALPKLLCGLPPEMPVLPDDVLPPSLQSEGLRLMQGLLEHAAPLQPASEAAFRASYLRRDGVLSVRAGTWLLQVERRPQDVLLERLAWSWDWVVLPWMAGPLQVEW